MNKDPHKYKIIKDIGFSLLEEGKIIKVRADGYSMFPSVKPGSLVFIQPAKDDVTLLPGEIVAWKRESGLVVHRLVRILKNDSSIQFVTRGDSCANEDKAVSKDQVVGKVIRIEILSGRIITGEDLIRRPVYLYNRILVRILLIIRKLLNIVSKLMQR
jgi:signal peptidase I